MCTHSLPSPPSSSSLSPSLSLLPSLPPSLLLFSPLPSSPHSSYFAHFLLVSMAAQRVNDIHILVVWVGVCVCVCVWVYLA